MTTVLRARLYGRSIEIKSNLRRKKLHKANEGSNFLGGSVSNRDNVKVPNHLEEEDNPSILKDDFPLSTDPPFSHL